METGEGNGGTARDAELALEMRTTESIDTGDRPLPPGPAEQFDIDVNEESFHRMWGDFQRYGSIYKIDSPRREQPTYVLNHPDLVQRVLAGNRRNYVKGPGFERVKMLLGNGLIVSEGEHWLRQRRTIQPAFHRDNISAMSEVMRRSNQDRLAGWERHADSGEPIDITQETSELALDIMLRTIFGDDLDLLIAEQGGNPFAMLVEHERDLALVLKFRALTKLVARLVEQRRRDDVHRQDFLSLYMDARNPQSGEPMTDKDLIDEIMTLIVAGHETTAATVNWIWYLLARHPEVEAKLHTEVDRLTPDFGQGPPDFAHLVRMPYAKRVMHETLRLYPPVWLFTRKALEEDVLGGYRVAPGTDILLSPYIVHRHPDFWDEPDAFRPERFGEEGVNRRHDYAYFPFSAGPRRCTGDFFSQVEVLTHLGLMARRFRLRYTPDRPLELEPAVNLRSKHGIKMTIERRAS